MSQILHKKKGAKLWKTSTLEDQQFIIICHQGNVDVKPTEDFIILDPEITVYHGSRVKNINCLAIPHIEAILGYPIVNIKERGLSDSHIIGLVDLLFKLEGSKFFIRQPETYLHPKQQQALGIFLTSLEKIM